MEKERNPEKHVARALDSILAINETVLITKTDELAKKVEANYKHIELMLAKDWFVAALTPEQKTNFEAAVAAGKAY